MSLAEPPLFRLAGAEPGGLRLESQHGDLVRIFVLEEDIVRLLVLPQGRLNHPHGWSIAPDEPDCPPEGRDRFDLAGFSLPAFTHRVADGLLELETAALRLEVRLAGFFCAWAMKVGGEWRAIAADRPTQAYDFGYWDGRPRHYLERTPGERYFGLGECSGDLDRAGRRFELRCVDAMGYDARTSDPLYKHIPFYITQKGPGGAAFGLFYDTAADCVFDFGQEIDNYHGPFRSFRAEHGDLDYYLIAGPRVDDVTRRFTWLTGRPAFPPRWALAYSGSSMAYADAPDAQGRMAEFLSLCEAHDIPCESLHLSSGYTAIGERRHVFHWNRDRFPDPAGFVRAFAERGVRLCANVKPCLMRGHPLFDEALAAGALMCEADGRPAWVQFWGEIGAYVDFTKPQARAWWKAKLKSALLDLGVAASWNDNNEYEITSPAALAHAFGTASPAWETKPVQTLLMARTSREAQVEHAPDKRPFLVTRSGGAGLHRYAQTWSGDNATAWETLRYNFKMGLGLALSGVSNAGHDIGGFAGPAPDAELLVRWVQAGLLLPRFSIHSWNDDGAASAPWMHPEAAGAIAGLIKLRHQLTPYLYGLMQRYHRDYEPVIQPLFVAFPDDASLNPEALAMMVGPSLLAAPVVEPGQARRELHLPAGTRWRDVWTGEVFEGGTTVSLPAPWDRPPLLAREGCAIPVNLAEPHFASAADQRGFLLYPHLGEGGFSAESFEDDGESTNGPCGAWVIRVVSDAVTLAADVERRGWTAQDSLSLILPPGETRKIVVEGDPIAEQRRADGRRVITVTA